MVVNKLITVATYPTVDCNANFLRIELILPKAAELTVHSPKDGTKSLHVHRWPRDRIIYSVSMSERVFLHCQHQCFGRTPKHYAERANVARWQQLQDKGNLTVSSGHVYSVSGQLQCKEPHVWSMHCQAKQYNTITALEGTLHCS